MGSDDVVGDIVVDLPFTVTNPAAVLSSDVVGDAEDDESCVLCVFCVVWEEVAATAGVSLAGGGVGVGADVEDVADVALASVSPGVSGCVARMDRSTSRNRICMAGPTVTAALAPVAVRITPQMPPRKSVVSDVHDCPLGTHHATVSPAATAGNPSVVRGVPVSMHPKPTSKPSGQMAGE